VNRTAAVVAVLLAIAATHASAQPYSARVNGDVVHLEDARTSTTVSVIPSVGNIAFDMTVKGQRILYWPFDSIDDFKVRPAMSGIPLLGPWADRLDEQAFFANGRKYPFDMTLGNIRGAMPSHGFITTTDRWQLVDTRADATSAWTTSRLEFYRQPLWMKQWPFAHTIEMTHRLRDGILEVETTIVNMSAEPMPIAIAFHPYFQLTDSPRDDWTLSVAARTHWLLTADKVPTGETEPIEKFFPTPRAQPIRDYSLDDVFTEFTRDDRDRATISVSGKAQRLDVLLGPNYRSVTIWSPKERPFICVEPSAGIIDALNLAARGLYKDLQNVAPGGTWRERFWVKTGGF